MDRRAAGALLALAACIASSAAAPTVSNQTALDLYDAASEGCYYNFQHYGEGDRIMTNEPCLNCTCHNRMLMCYLRVCPFTKPIGQDCTVEKRADQCCPIVTCPDVPVDLLTSTSTSSPAEYGATGLGKLDKYGCSISGKYFPEGSKVPPTPNKPCEHCYCIRNMTTCVMQECTLHVDGCTPIYHKDVCCPVRYSCDHPEDEMPLLDDMSTTVRPTPGFLLTTTTLSPVTQMTQDCVHDDQIFTDGTSIKTDKACEHCYCMKGDIVCVVQECGTPMENEGKNCTSQLPREGQCCPDTYICEGDEVTTDLPLDYTTELTLDKLTTLIPPRRVLDEGSGYRKEEDEQIATESPSLEPEVEGSGDDFATEQPPGEKDIETPTLIDDKLPSTEDLIGMETTPQSDVDKPTKEPDTELNTVPSDIIEPSEPSEPKLTTVSEDETKASEEMEQTHIGGEDTTTSLGKKDDEVSTQTTELTFRKDDDYHEPHDLSTEKVPDEYTTLIATESPEITKQETEVTIKEQEEFVTMSETKSTTLPTLLDHTQTEVVTDIPMSVTTDESSKEPSISSDHTESETTAPISDKSETTPINAQENEIEDVSTTPGPGRIPGEGDCLQNGITYRNESIVPSSNNCQTDCKCISSIIKCDPIICSPPPEYMNNCVPTYDSSESCCPTYVCDGSKETLPPQPHSQMSETTSSTPAIECHGDQCDVQEVDKSPIPSDSCKNGDCLSRPSDIPVTSDCGIEGCGDEVQTPVQIDVQPECSSEDCSEKTQPHEISPLPSETCSDGDCQQKPIEKDDSIQPCDSENCKIPSIQPCQSEEECKIVHTPKVEQPCEGESCKTEPSDCKGEGCKPSDIYPVPPTCEGGNCESTDKQEPECTDEECKKTIIPDITGLPSECSGVDCPPQPDVTDISKTEGSTPMQEKTTESPSITTEYLQAESTKLPEYEDKVQPSEETVDATTQKSIEVTEPEDKYTDTLQTCSEKPLRDSDENVEKTDKPSTDFSEMETTRYVELKETTPVFDSETQTDSKHELETTTRIILSPEIMNKDEEEVSQTTAFDNLVTKTPEVVTKADISKPEQTSEKMAEYEDVTRSSDAQSEITEPSVHDITEHPEKEALPEFTTKPEISDIPSLEQHTEEPELGSGEEITDTLEPTEQSVSDNNIAETEIPVEESDRATQAPVEPSHIDQKIETTSPTSFDLSTEDMRLETSIAPELHTTSIDTADEAEPQEKVTEIPYLQTGEPEIPTSPVPESHIDSKEPSEQDDDKEIKPDTELSTAQPSISPKTDTPEIKEPYTEKEKMPDQPSEEIFTEQPEINTEEPTLITQHDEEVSQEPIEPESPYIPVQPIEDEKLESDLISKQTTPQSIPDVDVSTEYKLHSTTPETVTVGQTQEFESETKAPELENDMTETPDDNRKYNQDSTEVFEPITKIDELTTIYPEEKQTASTTYSELPTPKPHKDEHSYVTVPSESFTTEKQDVIPTEMPASHVKETETEEKLMTISEITTEKLTPIQSEESDTPSPTLLEPKPTEVPTPVAPMETEQEKEPEHDLATGLDKTTEPTSEPKFEYSETTPDMIELVEHSTLSSSISDQTTSVSAETEETEDKFTTERLVTSEIERGSEETTTVISVTQDTEDITPTKQPAVTEKESIPELPESHDVDEIKPDEVLTTLKPEIDETKPHIPVEEMPTEVMTDEGYSTKQPDITDIEQQTVSSEDTRTEKPDVSDLDIDKTTSKQPEVSVTELNTEPQFEITTEKPEIIESESTPDKRYSTEKPEIDQQPTLELETSTVISEEPSLEEQPVTDKQTDIKELNVDDKNEVTPEIDSTKPTTMTEIEEEMTAEKETTTEESGIATTEREIIPHQDLITESPMVSETAKETETESSTENKKLFPDRDHDTSVPDMTTTEKESTVSEEQTMVTKYPEPEIQKTETSTNLAETSQSENEVQFEPSTAQPESSEPEQTITTRKETSTEISLTTKAGQETEPSDFVEYVKPDEETLITLAEKQVTTEKTATDADTDKEPPVKEPEPSDMDNEITVETTTRLSEHKLVTEASVTEQPSSSVDQEIVNEVEPSTERIIIPDSESVTEGQAPITEEHDQLTEVPASSQKPATDAPHVTEIQEYTEKESFTEKIEEPSTISPEIDSKTTKSDIFESTIIPEIITREPETSDASIPEHDMEPHRHYSTEIPEVPSVNDVTTTTASIPGEKETSTSVDTIELEQELTTKQPVKPEVDIKDEEVTSSIGHPVDQYEITEKSTKEPAIEEYTKYDDKETLTTKSEDAVEKLTTTSEVTSVYSSTEKIATEMIPETHDDTNKQDEDVSTYTTSGYTPKEETMTVSHETEKPEEVITVHTETEKPVDVNVSKDTTAPEEEFLTVTTKATTPKVDTEISTPAEDLDKITKPHDVPEETASIATPEVSKPEPTDEIPAPEEEAPFAPGATGGYGQEPDYEDENQPFGPGTCRYGGKVYVSAQQIPRDDPCDFCFCFRSDIICLQQSCPPPIHGCHEEPIQGFCCPRYECPVSMASTLNVTTTTTTTTTTLPPHFLPHAYQGAVQRRGCQIKGHTYKVGEVVRASSGPCLHCTCGGDGQMKCDPKACTPEPMLRQMIAAAVSAKRRR